MTLGEKIAKLRKENNITQEQLAAMFGVSRQVVSRWESDAAYPETDKLLKMSGLFKRSLDYLLRDGEEAQIAQDKAPAVQSMDYSGFIGAWCNIDLKNWDSGYDMAAMIGQDNRYMYFYQTDKSKSLKYGLVSKRHIDTVTKLELKTKKRQSLPALPDPIPSVCDPFEPLLDKICTVQMHSPNLATLMLSTDGYQKVLVTAVGADSIQIREGGSVVILNKRDIAGIVES